MTEWTPVDLLPGLYAGMLAILLWWTLRRWYDAVPPRIAAVFSVALAILFGPVLFGGKLLLPLDNLRGHAPFRHFPLVEPQGNVLQGDLIQLIYPSLAAAREDLVAGHWPLWNRKAGAGMPLLADPQSQALQPIALLTLPMPWPRAVGVMATLRVLLALTFSFLWMRRQGLGEGAALAGSLAFSQGGFLLLWLGWPMANSAALLPVVLYALVRCKQEGSRRDLLLLTLAFFTLLLGGHPETILYVLGLSLIHMSKKSAIALALAASLAAPALLPFLDYLPHTLRASREIELKRGDLAEHWLPIAAPNAFGNSRYMEYWGLNNTNEDAAGFCGTVTLLLVLLGLWSSRRFPQERLFLGVAVACLLLLSPWGPGTRRLLLPLVLSLSYLGACTLEREVRKSAVVLAALGLGAVIAWAYLTPGPLETLRTGWLHWQGRFLTLGTLLLLFGMKRRWTAPAAAVLIATELLLAHLPANPAMPQHLASFTNGPLQFLQINLKQYRMAALDRAFPPNSALLFGISDARVYNPMAPAEYLRTLEPVQSGWWGELPELAWRRKRDNFTFRRIGVRYLLTEPGVGLPLRRVFEDRDAWIYEIPRPRQTLYLDGETRGRIGRSGIRMREPGTVASTLYQDGGWRVLLDRKPVKTGKNGPFLELRLPAGRWRFDLLYRPRAFLLGCLIAALGLAAGIAWLAPPPTARAAATRSEGPG